jgi:Secretion system C-terminal sorting domain
LSVYPNPVTNSSVISVELQKDDEVEIYVSDLSGKVITTLVKGTLTEGIHVLKIDRSLLLTGTYLVTMKGAFHAETISFINY